MIRVFAVLMRHAQFERPPGVPSARSPRPLTPEGERVAAESARRVLQLAIELDGAIDPTLDASPLLRAWQSAQILSDALEARTGDRFRVDERPALMERGLGSAANLTLDEIEQVVARDPRYPSLHEGWRRDPGFRLPLPGAESLVESGRRAAGRIRAATEKVAARAGRNTLKLFVAHGGCLRHAAVELGALALEAAPRLSMDYCEPVVLERRADGSWPHVAGQWKKRLRNAGGMD